MFINMLNTLKLTTEYWLTAGVYDPWTWRKYVLTAITNSRSCTQLSTHTHTHTLFVSIVNLTLHSLTLVLRVTPRHATFIIYARLRIIRHSVGRRKSWSYAGYYRRLKSQLILAASCWTAQMTGMAVVSKFPKVVMQPLLPTRPHTQNALQQHDVGEHVTWSRAVDFYSRFYSSVDVEPAFVDRFGRSIWHNDVFPARCFRWLSQCSTNCLVSLQLIAERHLHFVLSASIIIPNLSLVYVLYVLNSYLYHMNQTEIISTHKKHKYKQHEQKKTVNKMGYSVHNVPLITPTKACLACFNKLVIKVCYSAEII